MSELFAVGEIAILQNCDIRPELNGAEVTITGGLDTRPVLFARTIITRPVLCYLTNLAGEGGWSISAKPHQLRKKRPPQSDTGEIRIFELFTKPPVSQPVTEDA